MKVWKVVDGFEKYEVSDKGEIRRNEKIMTPFIGRNGYYTIHFRKDGKQYTKMIHRIVAMMFIPNPNNYPCVNHKDENKLNNFVSNLEWCTYKYNSNYGTAKERARKSMRRTFARCIETNEILSIKQWRNLGYYSVSKVCKGEHKQCNSLHFEYYKCN